MSTVRILSPTFDYKACSFLMHKILKSSASSFGEEKKTTHRSVLHKLIQMLTKNYGKIPAQGITYLKQY
jgi:hypothetical protein